MATGSFTNYVKGSNSSNYFGLYGEYTFASQTSDSIAGNYTDVTVSLWIRYYSLSIGARSGGYVTINGTQCSFSTSAISSFPSGGGGVTKLTQQTVRVYHNNDGTKGGIAISAYFPVQATYSGTYYASLTASTTTVALPTIPRASSITSAGNVTLGNACSVKWTPASSSFKYKLTFTLGSWSTTTGFISPATTNAYTYTGYNIPGTSTMYALIPNSPTGTMSVTLTTYNSSGSQIGSTSAAKTFTVTVPSTIKPSVGTITLNPADINGQNILVQGKNKLTVSVSGCAAGSGSSIKSYSFSGPGISYTGTSTSTTSSSNISQSGSLTYTVTVTDARGRSTSKTAAITCYEYTAPYFTSFNAYRVASSSSTTTNNSGTYVRCSYGVSYSSVGNTNSATVKILYKTGNGSWKSATASSNSLHVLSSMSLDSTYTIYATITDQYSGSASSATITVFSAERTININEYGNGIGIGKMAEYSNLLDVKWAIKSEDKYVVTAADVLFNSSIGTSATVYLTNSLANYLYIDICYSLGSANNMYPYNCTRIYNPDGKQICLSLISADLSTPAKTHIYRSHYSLFEKEISMYNTNLAAHVTINGSSISTTTGTNGIKIFQVFGYKR